MIIFIQSQRASSTDADNRKGEKPFLWKHNLLNIYEKIVVVLTGDRPEVSSFFPCKMKIIQKIIFNLIRINHK